MKVLTLVALVVSVLMVGCSKNSSDGGGSAVSPLPYKEPELWVNENVKPGRWISKDENTGLTHAVTRSTTGKLGYEIQREVKAPVFKRESGDWRRLTKNLNGIEATVYKTYLMIERSEDTAGVPYSSCLSEESPCLSREGLLAARGLPLKEDAIEFEISGHKFSRADLAEKRLNAGGQFTNIEGNFVFQWPDGENQIDDLNVSFKQVDKYDYQVSLDPQFSPKTTYVLYSVISNGGSAVHGLIDLKDPKRRPRKIQNGVVVQFQAYSESNDGLLEPNGKPQEILMPTFKLDPDDFQGELLTNPEKAFKNGLSGASVRVVFPYTPDLHERIEFSGVQKIISKREGYVGALYGDVPKFEGRIGTSKVSELIQGSTLIVYFKVNGGRRKFDYDEVQVLATQVPIYDFEYHVEVSCVLEGPVSDGFFEPIAKLTFTAPRPIKWQIVSHLQDHKTVEISKWTDQVQQFTKAFDYNSRIDKYRNVMWVELNYIDELTGRKGTVKPPWLDTLCYRR